MLPYNSTGTESSLSLSECDDPKNKDSVANCGYDLVGNFFKFMMPLVNGSNIVDTNNVANLLDKNENFWQSKDGNW